MIDFNGTLITTFVMYILILLVIGWAAYRRTDDLPDFFERTFDDRSRLLCLVSAIFILIFFTFYASSGLVAGGVTVIVWKQLSGGIFDLYEIVPGFIVSALLIVLFSWASGTRATPRRPARVSRQSIKLE